MLEQAGLVRRGYDAGRAMQIELLPADAGASADVDALLDRYERAAAARVERIVEFAEDARCRHLQVAEHFGETLGVPCGACDVCAPRTYRSQGTTPVTRPVPDEPAQVIFEAVEALTWPLGRRSLVAMLRGRHRQRLLVHARRTLDVQDVIRDWLGEVEWGSKVRVSVDVDPYSFL